MRGSKFGAYLIPICIVVVVHSLLGVPLPQTKEPELRFKDFPVHKIFRGRPASPVFPKGFGFPTKVREAARKGPNFAGHYTIANWGCGSGCESFAVVDAISGKLYNPRPFGALGVPFQGRADGRAYGGLGYRLDSALLIADGCPEEDRPGDAASEKCAARYYTWKDHQFHLLATIEEPPASDSGPAPTVKPSNS